MSDLLPPGMRPGVSGSGAVVGGQPQGMAQHKEPEVVLLAETNEFQTACRWSSRSSHCIVV